METFKDTQCTPLSLVIVFDMSADTSSLFAENTVDCYWRKCEQGSDLLDPLLQFHRIFHLSVVRFC